MGNRRKLTKLEDDLADLQERLRVISEHAWTMQLVAACLLERFCPPNGSCLLEGGLRQRSIDEEWGVRTEVLKDDDVPRGEGVPPPMAVILEKPTLRQRANLDGARKAVIVPRPKGFGRRR